MQLLKRQNPDIPTDDSEILKVIEPTDPNSAGPTLILQINKSAKDLLYARKGKMAWGMACAYLRLKKRVLEDANENTFETVEVEKDLGLESLATATSNCTLEELTSSPDDINFQSDTLVQTHGTSTPIGDRNVKVPTNKPSA